MAHDLAPSLLSWAEVDPRLHPFDGQAATSAVEALEPARYVPARPTGPAGDPAVISWSDGEGSAWTEAMTRALVERFGRWVLGWRWARNEGDIGGGPLGSWCCPRDSITTPKETVARVAAALCEWRDWLEDLAERFDQYRLDSVPIEDRQQVWENAAFHLITLVVDRTSAGDLWYIHCEQVLTWLLTRWDVPPSMAEVLVGEAIGERFECWIWPERHVVEDVAERLALSLTPSDGA